ncbi:hypothetical protein [Macrococcus animalis]|uniref:hypothetical protein n=1 Tax=Macrococcus animalis TaxID=3395467 RepID=UPI0039BE3939
MEYLNEKDIIIIKYFLNQKIFSCKQIGVNEPTAFMALNVFLRKNNKRLVVDQMDAVEFTVKIANDRLEEGEIAQWSERFIDES